MASPQITKILRRHWQHRCGTLLLTTLLGVGSTQAAEPPTTQLAEISEHPTRSAPATAVSLNRTTLSARIQASVERIHVGVSETVTAGTTLLTLDCTDYQLALEQSQAGVTIAQARLKLAENQQRRANQLLAKDLTSRENADTTATEAIARQAELAQAHSDLEQAKVNVGRCHIKAPFDGIITERMASEGQLATIGTPLIGMVDIKNLELSALVKPNEVQQLKQASHLQFIADQPYQVNLLRIGGVINSETRDQEIRLAFPELKPPPGMAGKLQWQDPRSFVPAQYIVSRDSQRGIFIVDQGKARFVELPQSVPGRPAAVDLPNDSLIIIKGLGRLQQGDPLP